MRKLSPTLLLSIIFLLFLDLGIFCSAIHSSFGCFAHERDALLNFKASLVDPSNRLSSWEDDTNCCNWEGVGCHNITRHVVKLDLRSIPSILSSDDNSLWSKSLDSSLMELKYLNYLDLSGNNFNTNIPTFLGSMKLLQHLNLSWAGFHGSVPHHLGNLSNLRTLDIGNEVLMTDDLWWISNLLSLEYLDLDWIDLSQTKDIIKVLSLLPSLVVLSLSHTSLNNNHVPHSCVNSTLLSDVQYLDMSTNSFIGELPCFLHNMTSLESLDLSENQYNSTGQPFLRLKNLFCIDLRSNNLHNSADWISELLGDKCQLKSLDLSSNEFYEGVSGAFKNLSACRIYELESVNLGHNHFSGSIPESFEKLSSLIKLDTSWNKLSGSIPESIGKLSFLNKLDISGNKLSGSIPESIGKMSSLTKLDISWNKLSGYIPKSIGNLSTLVGLYISCNELSGSIPESFGKLSSLIELDIQDNELCGEIPTSFGQLSNLESIDISLNAFNGTLSEAHFSNLSKLKYLAASSNSIKFKVQKKWMPPFQLESLSISSCNMEGERFPSWLQTQKALTQLELSNCSISGTLPKWLGGMTNLTRLYLSKNHISGTITELPSGISILDLSENMITHLPRNIGHVLPNLKALNLARNSINGSLPDSLCKLKALHSLDLAGNHLSGNLLDCWQNFPNLMYVELSFNELSGVIPISIEGANSLIGLWLANNRLRGQLPSTLKNCSFLEILDVGENKLSGEIPEWLGNHLIVLLVLRLRDNQFRGAIPRALCQASRLRVLDLGINKLIGEIPDCFQNFSGMIFPGYSVSSFSLMDLGLHQVLKGVEMEYTSRPLENLANLDISCNNLEGGIPSELTVLHGLKGLNLSHNNLYGEIPRMIGEMSALESLDLSNNNLFGKIPESLANLTYLSRLNLSNNYLSGQIPTGRQLQTLEDAPSIYAGNPLLCGDPLPKKCHSDKTPKRTNAENHVADTIDKLWLYAFVIGGFASGLWGFVGVLVFKRSWRHAYFRWMEVVIRKMVGH